MRHCVTESPAETEQLGREIGARLRGGEVVMLTGPLGAGKSVLARGIGAALGASRWRGSPTFTLVNEYPTQPRLYHLDLYRLEPGQIDDLGVEEYARQDSVLVVEWADRDLDSLRSLGRASLIAISHLPGDRRSITLDRELAC